MKRLFRSLGWAMAALVLASCTTPPQALDQANNGVRLTQNLQSELARYQRNSKLSAQRRLNSIQELETGAGEISRDHRYDAYLASTSGKTQELDARVRIRQASDTYAELISKEEQSRQELVIRLAAIVQGLPSPVEKLGALQKTMADLGTELTMAERVAIVTKFLDEAKAIIDKNAKDTKGTAPAPAPAASAAPASGG